MDDTKSQSSHTPNSVAGQRTACSDNAATDPPRLNPRALQRLVRREPGEQRLKVRLFYLEGLSPLAFLGPRVIGGRLGRPLLLPLRRRGDDGRRGVALEGGYTDLAAGPQADLFARQFAAPYALAYPPFGARQLRDWLEK